MSTIDNVNNVFFQITYTFYAFRTPSRGDNANFQIYTNLLHYTIANHLLPSFNTIRGEKDIVVLTQIDFIFTKFQYQSYNYLICMLFQKIPKRISLSMHKFARLHEYFMHWKYISIAPYFGVAFLNKRWLNIFGLTLQIL